MPSEVTRTEWEFTVILLCTYTVYDVLAPLMFVCYPCTSPVTVKLWQPRHVKRTRRDLSELDVCLTLYDEVVREAM